jgi:hypothetical protein
MNFQELLLNEIKLLLLPLATVGESGVSGELLSKVTGWELEAGPITDDLLVAVRDAYELLDDLIENPPESLTDFVETLDKVDQLVSAVRQIPAAPGTQANLEQLTENLIQALVIEYLRSWHPAVYNVLGLLTVIEPPEFSLNRISDLVSDPIQVLRAEYLPPQGLAVSADATAVADKLFPRIAAVLRNFGYESVYDGGPNSAATLGALSDRVSPGVLTVFLQPNFEIADRGGIRLALSSADLGDFGLVVLPFGELVPHWEVPLDLTDHPAGFAIGPQGLTMFGAGDTAGVGVRPEILTFRGFLIGSTTGSRLEIGPFLISGDVNLNPAAPTDLDYGLLVDTGTSTLVIAAVDGDGFLQKVLPPDGARANFDLALGWSRKRGLYFRGSAGLDATLPVGISIAGILTVPTVHLALKASNAGVVAEVSMSVGLSLGPLEALVDRVGVTGTLTFPDDGNLGVMDAAVAFKAPNGVALSLDAGGFKGGGFLMLDSEKGEYAGALELDFNGLFSVKAIGVINTKMPDGSKGFSLLIVISSEFTPIQLSFGFTLNGVGGIFGLNRGINLNALAEGIRTNAVKNILFPENVIANISRIISDIKQFFPPQPDHFVVGPMAKLGWGTPSIITVELGLLLDLPNPMFAIVGVLKALLPEEKAPILRLQVNFLGVVDFHRGYVFFRANLFDSRLLTYSITGSMAFLVSWGEAETFALSVGGFHPDFRDLPAVPALPDAFRSLARIGLSLLSDDNPRLKVESYFAVTSNTVQFGARVELYAEAGGFNVYGFLGYDVLFQFDPFRFVAKLTGGVALRRRTSTIASVNISATLSGPTPWDARGKATLSLLFFSISVGFHVTWGDPPPAISAATEDLLELLKREFADTRNWRADLPPSNHLHVSLRAIDLPAATVMLVVHPAGVLTFSQRSLPLEDFVIQKFGNKKPLAENKFRITNANSGGAPIPADFQNVREQFAPGNFLELSDSEKLSRKSFDKLPSGFKLTATSDLLTTLPVVRPVDYELSYLRSEEIVPRGPVQLFVLAYDRLVKGSAVRQSGLAKQQTRVSLNAPPQVGLPQETFAVANAADLRSQLTTSAGPVLFATQAEAYQQQQELIAQTPALAGQLQVVSHFELNVN